MVRYLIGGEELLILDHPEVYPPAEDTFLMLRALEVGRERVLELGTGSGIIAVYCARKGALVLCTDINPHALRLARQNARRNGVALEAMRADLFDGIRGSFDLVIFNPPYLPTSGEDLTGDRWLDASVSGGGDGLEPLRRFLDGLDDRLRPGGRALATVSSLSGKGAPPLPGYRARPLASEGLELERLTVFEYRRRRGRA